MTSYAGPDVPHGTTIRHARGCRCDPCREAHNRQHRLNDYDVKLGRPRTIDATGTRRRLQALAAMGYPIRWLSSQVTPGCHYHGALYAARVHNGTAETVTALYDRLSMTPGPSRIAAQRAAKRGWPPPLAWDDDTIDNPQARPVGLGGRNLRGTDPIAVERACAGDTIPLGRADRAAAVIRLAERGLSDPKIAQQLQMPVRSVLRIRRRRDAQTAANRQEVA